MSVIELLLAIVHPGVLSYWHFPYSPHNSDIATPTWPTVYEAMFQLIHLLGLTNSLPCLQPQSTHEAGALMTYHLLRSYPLQLSKGN